MVRSRLPRRRTSTRRRLLVTLTVLTVALVAWAPDASAHGGDATNKGSNLVRQAIAIMVNEPDNTPAVADKLADASRAADQSGVEPNLLSQARDALAAGELHRARALAERSIGAQLHRPVSSVPAIGDTAATTTTVPTPMPAGTTPGTSAMPGPSAAPPVAGAPMAMAAGAEPGQASFADPLTLSPSLSGRDWTVLGLSVAIGLAGVYLSLRFRPSRRRA